MTKRKRDEFLDPDEWLADPTAWPEKPKRRLLPEDMPRKRKGKRSDAQRLLLMQILAAAVVFGLALFSYLWLRSKEAEMPVVVEFLPTEEGTTLSPAMLEAEIERLRDEGYGFYWAANWRNAATVYTRLIELDPDTADHFYWRGLVYNGMEDFSAAIADYSRAIELDVDVDDYWYARGYARYYLGDLEAALEDFDMATMLNANNAWAYAMRGLIFVERGQLSLAIQDYNRAIQLEPEDFNFYLHRAMAYHAEGRIDRAVSDMEQYLELGGDHAASWAADTLADWQAALR